MEAEADELQLLRAEVAELRRDLNRVLDLLDQRDEPDYPRPAYGNVEFQQVNVRCGNDCIPIILHSDPEDSVVALYDAKQCLRAELGVYATGQAGLTIFNDEGKEIVFIGGAEDNGGLVGVRGPDGAPRACMRSEKQDGVVSVVNQHGDALAFLRSTEVGGLAGVANQQKRQAVIMRAAEQGGMITLHEPSGELMVHLTVVSNGGLLTLHGEQGMPGATLSACGTPAGALVLYEADGEVKAVLP